MCSLSGRIYYNYLYINKLTKKKRIMIGKRVIVRSDRAGVFYGTLKEKEGNEVVLLKLIGALLLFMVVLGIAGKSDYEDEVYSSMGFEERERIAEQLGEKATISRIVAEYEKERERRGR